MIHFHLYIRNFTSEMQNYYQSAQKKEANAIKPVSKLVKKRIRLYLSKSISNWHKMATKVLQK